MVAAEGTNQQTNVFEDDASTTAELLASLWDLIVEGEEMERGEQKTVYFPACAEKLGNPTFVSRLMNHLNSCKDVCDEFGISILLIPQINQNQVTEAFTVKSFGEPLSMKNDEELDETGGYLFNNDEFWNDEMDFDIDPKLFEDDEDEEEEQQGIFKEKELPSDEGVTDADMVQYTKKWVDTMMSNMGICPFTNGPDMAGLPLGKVYYTVDNCETVEQVYASYWKELVRLEQSNEKELSTTLLLLPKFALHNIELFENFSTTLTQPLEPLALEDLTQLVFFHPRWTFRDGGANRAGGDSKSANYARRSPWPMINLLRTNQVRAAQRGIPTGLVYSQNEKTLKSVGSQKLENMLHERNWDGLDGMKVNRKEHDALSMAKDMQELATEGKEEAVEKIVQSRIGEGFDKAVAANKMDRPQMDEGNLVNVVKQALTKRITGVGLTGAEMSATLMATDYLIEVLERIAEE